MSVVFSRAQTPSIGTTAKAIVRDYLATNIHALNGPFYAMWAASPGVGRGFDCKLQDELLNGEFPDTRPLLSIATRQRTRKSRGQTTRIEFILELRVLADDASGAVMDTTNPVASHEQLSDDLESVLDNEAARTALAALGLEGVQVGERREQLRDKLHLNVTALSFAVNVEATA